jgi:protein SCO1/2
MRAWLWFLILPLAVCAQNTARVFQATGVVVGLVPEEKTIEISHDAIPGYMSAMTMPFEVKNINELTGLATNDAISFHLVVTETNGWVEQIRKTSGATNRPAAVTSFRPQLDVQPLNEGDPLPEYHFTNQWGKVFSTADFKGQALAITFLFTRCPFPTYCPLMADNFNAVQKKMLSATNGPANWHLLTISFDPQFDTPEVLRNYAEAHGDKSDRWTFATGALSEITGIGENFGLTFWHDENGSINHNLRTAVIDASGRVQNILIGNQWTPDELAADLVKAARVPAK